MGQLSALPALDVRPPATPPNALAEFGQVAAIQSHLQQQQIQQQEIQKNQQALTDNAAVTKAMRDWDPSTGDYNALTQAALKNGASANAATALQQHGLQVTDLAAKLSDTQRKAFQEKRKAIADDLQPLTDPTLVPDDQLHGEALNHVMRQVQAGNLSKEEAQPLIAGIQQTQDPTALRNLIMQKSKTDLGMAGIMGQQKTAAETAEATAKTAQAKAEAAKANLIQFPELGIIHHVDTGQNEPVSGQTMTPGMMESKYVGLQQQKGEGKALSTDDQAFVRSYEHLKTLVPQFNINMAASGAGMIPGGAGAVGAPGAASGAAPAKPDITQVPNAIRGTVQQIVDYRGQLPPAGRNNPTNTAIRYWVNTIDPQHDDTYFPARNKMMTAMTSGPEATQINAINTALGHVGVLNDAIDALHNSDGGVKALRDIANKLGVQVGDTPVTTLNTIIHRVGPELTAAYVQGGGGEGERGTTQADFDPSLGNAQLKANAGVTAQLLRSKIGSLENQYKNTMGRDDFQQRFMTPEALHALQTVSAQSPVKGGGGTSGKAVSLSAAKQLPAMQGKTDEEITELIKAQGHTVKP